MLSKFRELIKIGITLVKNNNSNSSKKTLYLYKLIQIMKRINLLLILSLFFTVACSGEKKSDDSKETSNDKKSEEMTSEENDNQKVEKRDLEGTWKIFQKAVANDDIETLKGISYDNEQLGFSVDDVEKNFSMWFDKLAKEKIAAGSHTEMDKDHVEEGVFSFIVDYSEGEGESASYFYFKEIDGKFYFVGYMAAG